VDYVSLTDGVRMPILGFGTWQVSPQAARKLVADALKVGYRSFDTAQVYGNEAAVGAAVHASDVARSDVFITTKVWTSGYDSTRRSINSSLRELSTDYIDLLLIHEPGRNDLGTYRALEDAKRSGKARAIGLSNFYGSDYTDLVDTCEVTPAINQLETHVFWQQHRTRALLAPHGTKLMSWAPFAEGMNDFFIDPVLAHTGAKYGKTVAQTALRFLIQNGIVVIPRTTRPERMAENLNVFDFTLDDQDMARITALDSGRSIIGWP
jgi:2,5-diketo-D-gluconate reductase A